MSPSTLFFAVFLFFLWLSIGIILLFKRKYFFSSLVLALPLLGGIYSFWIEPNWIQVTHHSVEASLEAPIKIAHLSDLHIRNFGYREKKLIKILETEKPDLIVVTGDIVSGKPNPSAIQEVFKKIHAPRGVWMVFGNWDHWRRIKDPSFFQSLGVHLLNNSHQEVGKGFWLAGVDDAVAGNPDAEKTFEKIPPGAFTLVLFHSPVAFDQVAGRVSLALAGHTHGGQVKIPFWGPLWLPPGSGNYREGWYEQKGSRMYVSRGIGNSILQARFFCRPEIAIIELKPKK